MDKCPLCKSETTSIISHISVMPSVKQLRVELLCISCGITYLSHANPYHPSDSGVHHVRMTFECSWKPRGKATKRMMWRNDCLLYKEWVLLLNRLSESLSDQIESRKYSDFCVHWLYVTIRLLSFLRAQLDKRIKQLEYVLEPAFDD